MIMDEQSPNPLAADSDSGEEFTRHGDSDFLNDTDSDFLPDESDEIKSGDGGRDPGRKRARLPTLPVQNHRAQTTNRSELFWEVFFVLVWSNCHSCSFTSTCCLL